MSARLAVPAMCQSCGGRGVVPADPAKKPRWCTCDKGPRHGGGPFVAPPGVVVVYRFESRDDHAFRERCRLVGNAERRARDDLSGRFVRSGRGYRELPKSSPKRRGLETAYRRALRALEAVQAECAHGSRSIFNRVFCDVCYAHVECDVEHHRHLVRTAGARFANRVAV